MGVDEYKASITVSGGNITIKATIDGQSYSEVMLKYSLSGTTLTIKDAENDYSVFVGTKQ